MLAHEGRASLEVGGIEPPSFGLGTRASPGAADGLDLGFTARVGALDVTQSGYVSLPLPERSRKVSPLIDATTEATGGPRATAASGC